MKLFITPFFFLFSFMAFAQPEVALIKAVQAKLAKVNNYVATGKMSVDVSFIKAPPSNVTIYYKKPDQLKIKNENGLSILPKGGININISSLLNTNNFTAVAAGAATVNGLATKVVKLLPLNEGNQVVLATLYIDEKNLLVQKAAVTTKDNGSYEMAMNFGKYAGWGLPDRVVVSFNTKEYKLPKGITFEYEKGDNNKASAPKNEKGKVEISYYTYSINKGINEQIFKN